MKINRVGFLKIGIVFSLMMVLAACVPVIKNKIAPKEIAFSNFLRGTVYLENSIYKIRLCGASNINVLFDPNQFLSKHFLQKGQAVPSLYVEFDASAAKSFDWQLEKIFFVSKKPQACGVDVQSKDYLVKGKNGLWQAEVLDNKVTLNKQNLYTRLSFHSNNHIDNKWRAQLQLAQGRQYKLRLDITENDCVDSLGQWHSLSAKMYLNNELHLGCARKGDMKKSFASGEYSNSLAIDSAFIVLNLNEDNSANLIIDYRNGHSMIVSKGNWKMLSNQVLELSLFSQEIALEQNVMLFQVFNNHELRLKGFSELLGKTGLKLLPINYSQ